MTSALLHRRLRQQQAPGAEEGGKADAEAEAREDKAAADAAAGAKPLWKRVSTVTRTSAASRKFGSVASGGGGDEQAKAAQQEAHAQAREWEKELRRAHRAGGGRSSIAPGSEGGRRSSYGGGRRSRGPSSPNSEGSAGYGSDSAASGGGGFDDDVDDDEDLQDSAHQLTSTALAFAYLANSGVADAREVSERMFKTSRYMHHFRSLGFGARNASPPPEQTFEG